MSDFEPESVYTGVRADSTNLILKDMDELTPQQKKELKQRQTIIQRAIKSSVDDMNDKKIIEEALSVIRGKEVMDPIIVTGTESKPFIDIRDDMTPYYRVGDFVKVSSNFSPYMNRESGCGFVTGTSGYGTGTIVSVKYLPSYGRQIHKNIPLKDVTLIPFMAEEQISESSPVLMHLSKMRKRKKVDILTYGRKKAKLHETRREQTRVSALIEKLKDGAYRSKGRGWLLKEKRLREGVQDINVTGSKLSAKEEKILHEDFLILETYIQMQPKQLQEKNKEGKFKRKTATEKAISIKYLVQHAYGRGKNYCAKLRKEQLGSASPSTNIVRHADPKGTECVIENREKALQFFTAKRMYALNSCRDSSKSLDYCIRTRHAHVYHHNEAMKGYDQLSEDVKTFWEMKAREHDEMQPAIKYLIIEKLKNNPKASWCSIEKAIGYWCSATTIRRWVTSFHGYRCYCERIIPLLSDDQKKKGLAFAKEFKNNHGLGKGKFLLVMYDEKWFWALVMRRMAKCCDELGIGVKNFKAYHKNHINKVMGICVVGFAFEDSIENGGEAVKIHFQRAQGMKIAKRQQKAAVRGDHGRITYSGQVIREKGETYMVDCAVTGSSEGTPKDPKFPLKRYFNELIFKRLDELVGSGGQYEGFKVIIQGDNAGPHEDAQFLKSVQDACTSRGWLWKPQAPQMPHMNVLDLSVFPSMSRRHIEKCRETEGMKVLSEDEVWATAADVWRTLPNSKIASAFIQAYRIADKVIAAKGDNNFLVSSGGTDGIHCGVRDDFYPTLAGLARKDGKKVDPPMVNLN